MADLIDRAKVLDAFKQICESCGKYKQYNGVMCGACLLDDAISIVEDTPSVVDTDLSGSSFRLYRAAYDRGKQEAMLSRAEPHWIPCSERLPEPERKDYWICTDGGYQYQCRWTNVNWFWPYLTTEWHFAGLPQYSEAVAWMPLPDPYREEGESQ